MHLICGKAAHSYLYVHTLWISYGHIASGHTLPSAGRCSIHPRSGTTCLKSSLENRCAHSRGHKLRYCNFVAWTGPLSHRSSLFRLLMYCTDLINTTQTVNITAVHPKHINQTHTCNIALFKTLVLLWEYESWQLGNKIQVLSFLYWLVSLF